MRVGFLFPGQGAQFVGMGRTLYEARPDARAVFDVASERLGYDAADVCLNGPDELLNSTEYTQPLLLTVCVAAHTVWHAERPDVVPTLAAGLSLGEYAALVVAGSLDFGDAVALTRIRGRLMQETVPKGVGGVAAIMGLDAAEVERLCAEVRTDAAWVEPANYNAPGQVVVSGHLDAVKAFCKTAKAAGAARALVLPVSAPFHSRLLTAAGYGLAAALADVAVRDAAAVPVVSNVTAEPLTRAADITSCLVAQVSSPVRMEQSLRYMLGRGVDVFLEFGPGDTMAKLVKRLAPEATVFSIGDTETLGRASQAVTPA